MYARMRQAELTDHVVVCGLREGGLSAVDELLSRARLLSGSSCRCQRVAVIDGPHTPSPARPMRRALAGAARSLLATARTAIVCSSRRHHRLAVLTIPACRPSAHVAVSRTRERAPAGACFSTATVCPRRSAASCSPCVTSCGSRLRPRPADGQGSGRHRDARQGLRTRPVAVAARRCGIALQCSG